MSRSLEGRIALVTGAARGIGAGIGRALHAEGATVWFTDLATDMLDAMVADLGDRAHARRLDVRAEADWQAAIDAVLAAHGRLDVLVNNAGITGFDAGFGPQDPEHASLADWRAVHATNLDGVFLGCKHGLRALRRSEAGSIINVGSRSGLVGVPGAAAYASSKAAIHNHTRSVALYCAEQGLPVRCNMIQPAAILTPMWEPMLGDGPDRAARMQACVADTPLRRFGTVEEVAALALYLASPASGYCTGAAFVLDGGLLAGSASPPVGE